MPIYEYHCHGCNDQFEVNQKISDPLLTECPGCGGKVEKMISQSSFVLKGSGWYATDYGSKKSAAPTPACGGGDKAGCAGCPSSAD